MRGFRAVQRVILLCYLAITGAAFVYTMTRVTLLPWPLIRFSYATMAPYQTYSRENEAVWAEAQGGDGQWRKVDLSPYYPEGFGEANLRTYFLPDHWSETEKNEPVLRRDYAALAAQLLRVLQAKGEQVTAVRLWLDEWPLSPGGFEADRHWPTLRTSLLAQVP